MLSISLYFLSLCPFIMASDEHLSFYFYFRVQA